MINIESLKKQYEETIEKSGGYSQVITRLMMARVYFALSMRVVRGEESVEFDSKGVLGDNAYLVDLCTRTGIAKLRIPAYSCFELKSNPNFDAIFQTNKIARLLKQVHPEAKMYLIYDNNVQLTDKVIREAKKEKLVEVWSLDAFLNHVDKVKQINDQIDFERRNWREKRAFVLDNAKGSFRENKCSLFLGAGVTMSAGGPSWEELLFKAIKKGNKSFSKRDFKKIYTSCGQSPIVLGRYLAPDKHCLDQITNYLQRFVLYKGVDWQRSELIKAICEFVESGNAESVITYNYDDLIETALNQRGEKNALSVYAKSRNTNKEIPVYHVHGLIPHDNSEMAATPVLSEKDYHDIYRESFHWSNIEQLHALDRNSCFFIGLSMTDPNLRRLLDFSHAGNDNEIHHFAFLKRESLYGEGDVAKNKQHFKTIEQQLESIGVWVIWFERYDEVSQMIRQIIAPMRLIG